MLSAKYQDDYIQLHPQLKPLWSDIARHYHRIGLNHTQNVIWDLGLEQLAAHEGYRPSVVYFGPEESKVWNDREWMEAVEFINWKNNFMALAEKLGIDVALTRCFAGVDEISEMDIISFNVQWRVLPDRYRAETGYTGMERVDIQDETQASF